MVDFRIYLPRRHPNYSHFKRPQKRSKGRSGTDEKGNHYIEYKAEQNKRPDPGESDASLFISASVKEKLHIPKKSQNYSFHET
jgi:hypothetical protein